MYDVAIIGGGVVGSLLARELSRYTMSVVVLESGLDVASGASKANSGIVHAGFDAPSGSLKARFNVAGNRLMPQIAWELGVHYRQNGSLVAAFSEEENTVLHELLARGKANGVSGLSIVSGDELRVIEPNLSRNITAALLADTSGIVCPYGLSYAAIGNAMDNGVELRTNYLVTKIAKHSGGYIINDDINAKIIVNAAGVFADEVARLVGDDSFEIMPRRGEYMLLDSECGIFTTRTVFNVPTKMGKGILLTPTVDGNYIVGPTSEDISDKSDNSVSLGGIAKLLSGGVKSAEQLPIRSVITSFCGLRAIGDTGDFIINENVPNFINAAAIESPGLTASPAIAEHIAAIITSKLSPKSNRKFNPLRKSYNAFRLLSTAEKNKQIAHDPRYGTIVCRCEGISEGEIVAAIHMNPVPTTVDGIKRRVRSGMGRCQGGFCMPLVMEILARELQVPIDSICKSNQGSEIVLGKLK